MDLKRQLPLNTLDHAALRLVFSISLSLLGGLINSLPTAFFSIAFRYSFVIIENFPALLC